MFFLKDHLQISPGQFPVSHLVLLLDWQVFIYSDGRIELYNLKLSELLQLGKIALAG